MIIICTPTRDTVHANTAMDVAEIVRLHAPDAQWMFSLGTYLPSQRTDLVQAALDHGADYIFFVDSDMRIPTHALKTLLAHDKPVIAANYRQRQRPKEWTAAEKFATVSSQGQTGLQRVHSLGLGCALIQSWVFRKLPKPWFANPFDGEHFVGEDIFLCHQLTKSGYAVWIDHDLSQDVRHISTVELAVEL